MHLRSEKTFECMNEENNFAIVRKPSSAVEKAAPGAKSILSGMVADTFALLSARIKSEAESWYENGVSCYVAQNYPEAVKWYRKAADQGVAGAQFSLGVCYDFGDGVTQDYAEAVKWYRKAADQGIAGAQNNLGNCYRDGQGVALDHAEAIKWYRKAADLGEARAQYNLGMCYSNGQGVAQDYSEAVKWFLKAAEKGNADPMQAWSPLRLGQWRNQKCARGRQVVSKSCRKRIFKGPTLPWHLL